MCAGGAGHAKVPLHRLAGLTQHLQERGIVWRNSQILRCHFDEVVVDVFPTRHLAVCFEDFGDSSGSCEQRRDGRERTAEVDDHDEAARLGSFDARNRSDRLGEQHHVA